MKKNFWLINASDNTDTAQIYLYGYIGSDDQVCASEFVQELMELQKSYKTIEVHINSQGGSVYEGLALITALKKCSAELVGYVDGIAASMAAVIALSLPKLYMSKYARLMTHRVQAGCYGNADEIRTQADQVQSVENDLVDILAKKTGLKPEQARAKFITNTDKWMTAQEAMQEGLINGVFDGMEVAVPEGVKDVKNVYNIFSEVINSTKTDKTTIILL